MRARSKLYGVSQGCAQSQPWGLGEGGERGSHLGAPKSMGPYHVRTHRVSEKHTARYMMLSNIGRSESSAARGRASSRVAAGHHLVSHPALCSRGDAQLHASLHCPCDRLQKGACKRAAALPLQFSAPCTRACGC